MRKKICKIVGVIALIFFMLVAIGSGMLGFYTADQIVHQNEGNDTKGNSVKQLEIWGYDLKAFQEKYVGEEITVTAEDGNIVPATVFRTNVDSDQWVILVHGAGGDRVSTYPLAEEYLERGYQVIAFDQRGSGENGDDKVTFGIMESKDVEAFVRYAKTAYFAEKVIVHGQSMGAQTVALYASRVTPGADNAADAIILDSPVPGMEYMMRAIFGDGPEGADSFVSDSFISISSPVLKYKYHASYDDGDTIAKVVNDQLPTLVILSEKDSVCLPEKVLEVYDNIGTDQKAVVYVNSEHIKGVIDDPDGYMNQVTDFLEQYD